MDAPLESVGPKDKCRSGTRTRSSRRAIANLLQFNLGADLFELLLHGFGVCLGQAFLDRLGRAVDEVLGFLEAEGGDLPDDLDHVDLLFAGALEDHGELGLDLFDLGLGRGGGGGGTGTAAAALMPYRVSNSLM